MRSCRRGDFFACQIALQITGISFDGGYAEYMVAPTRGAGAGAGRFVRRRERAADVRGSHDFQRSPQQRRAIRATWSAVLGLGGLGHLGVQFAAKMGFKTVAIARGKDKEPLARKLGAMHYIDSQTQDPAAELQ